MKATILILLTLFVNQEIFSQCSCMGGASIGSITPMAGVSTIGVLDEDNLRITTFFTYANGDQYYKGDLKSETYLPSKYSSSFLGLNFAYGLYEDFTVELETGYFINKEQEYTPDIISGNGFSHLSIYGKYNIFTSKRNELDWTLGLGGRIPLNFKDEYIPQNIQSSTGAYGLILQSYLHKGYKDLGLHFILFNKAEVNTRNENEYLYGSNFINSLFISQNIIDKLMGTLELRTDIRLKDNNLGLEIEQSGWMNIIVSPQISYKMNEFLISAFIDLPVYKYYNGSQLTNKYNLGILLNYQMDLY